MKIYIPTYKRTDNQVTIVNMPNQLKDLIYLVVRKEEHEELKKYHNKFIILPDGIDNIGKTRQYIIDNSTAVCANNFKVNASSLSAFEYVYTGSLLPT